jgi:hypothetical protein
MSSSWIKINHYQMIRHFCLLAAFMTSLAQAQPFRHPASYVPDDDVIVTPVDNQVSLYQQYIASDESADVALARNQIKVWNDNQVFADQYGLSTDMTGSSSFVPTPEQKWEYFNDKYLRYLRRKGERPLQQMPQTWYQEYRASNEVDTIDEMESRFKNTNKKSTSGNVLPDKLQAKEVSLWKKTTFIFQPRVEQGLVLVGFRTPFAYARAWVGVNGRTEVNVQQDYKSIGLRAMFNYYADSGEYFTSVDQRIMDNVYARYTRNFRPDSNIQDDTIMLLYGKQF